MTTFGGSYFEMPGTRQSSQFFSLREILKCSRSLQERRIMSARSYKKKGKAGYFRSVTVCYKWYAFIVSTSGELTGLRILWSKVDWSTGGDGLFAFYRSNLLSEILYDPLEYYDARLDRLRIMRSTEDLPAYSSIEVAKHASQSDAWLVIGGKVLDVTNWIEEHPGGVDVLLDHAGRDATREFEDVGHSSDARSKLDSFVIGTSGPATDAELRISRRGGGTKMLQSGGLGYSKAIHTWLQGNLYSLKRFGVISGLTVTVLVASVLLKRYNSAWISKGKQ